MENIYNIKVDQDIAFNGGTVSIVKDEDGFGIYFNVDGHIDGYLHGGYEDIIQAQEDLPSLIKQYEKK